MRVQNQDIDEFHHQKQLEKMDIFYLLDEEVQNEVDRIDLDCCKFMAIGELIKAKQSQTNLEGLHILHTQNLLQQHEV